MDGDKARAADRIRKENYISPEFLRREKEKLWPSVWQVACRLEEITKVGDYVTYEVADESIVVVRSAENCVKAYHNVCSHRGRQLAEGCGRMGQFRCRYHGWTYDLDGSCTNVQDQEDYGDTLKLADMHLVEVKLDTWGGFVFINMDPACESLQDFLRPMPEFLDPFEFENMRYRWYITAVMPANWKVTMEAFMEGYHVAAVHPQLLPWFGDDRTQSMAQGKHAQFGYWKMASPPGMPSPRLKGVARDDAREGIIGMFEILERELAAIYTDRDAQAATQLRQHAPAGVDPLTAFGMAVEFGRAAADAEGAGYPKGLSFEKLVRAGADFFTFPNCVTLPYFDGALWYRSRPNGDDPDTCVFDIWSLKRYAPGAEPPLVRRTVDVMGGESICAILDQDVSNLKQVQRGMKSRAFRHARPNPVQEVEVSNFHRVLEEYLKD